MSSNPGSNPTRISQIEFHVKQANLQKSLAEDAETRAEDLEVKAKSRGDDPKALAEAWRVLNDATGGAEQAQEAGLTDTTDVRRAVTIISRETQNNGAT